MLLRPNSKSGVCFQIHKNGSAVDGVSYSSLEEAAAALVKTPQGGEVTAVDGVDQIVRRYTTGECRAALQARNKQ